MQAVTKLKNECRELEDRLGESDKVALAEYEKERISIQREIDRLSTQFADHCELVLEEKQEIEIVEDQIEELHLQERQIVLKAEKTQDHMTGMSEEKRDIDHKLAQAKIAAQSALSEINSYETLTVEAQEAVSALEVQATKPGERITTRLGLTPIETEIMKLQELIARNPSSTLIFYDLNAQFALFTWEFELSQK